MPSDVMSCILQHDDIIRMANLSTTKIRHSFALGLHAGVFPLKRITSFIISTQKQNYNIKINNLWKICKTKTNGRKWKHNKGMGYFKHESEVSLLFNMITRILAQSLLLGKSIFSLNVE